MDSPWVVGRVVGACLLEKTGGRKVGSIFAPNSVPLWVLRQAKDPHRETSASSC